MPIVTKHEIYSFIKFNPMWVDIPEFMKYIRGQPKGFLFKVCYDILKIIDRDWNGTIFRNSNQNVRKFKEIYKSLNIQNNIPNINQVSNKEKFKHNAGCNVHRNLAQGEEGQLANYRLNCPRYYRVEGDYPWFYRNPTWICIPKMLEYLVEHNTSLDETREMLKPLFIIMNHDFVNTFVRNTLDDFALFKAMCDQIGFDEIVRLMLEFTITEPRITMCRQQFRDKHLPRAQALDDIISFPTNVNVAAQSLTATMPMIKQAAENVAQVAGNLNNVMSFITEVINNWKEKTNALLSTVTSHMGMLLEYFVKILALAYLLQQPNNQTLANAIALLTLILPAGMSASILPFAEGLIRVIKGMMGAQAQADEDDCGFIRSFFSLTLGIAKGMFGDVPKEVFDSLNISSRKVKLIADYIRGTSTIIECLVKIFSKILEWFGEGVIKYFGYIPSFLKEETLTPLIDEFMQIKLDRIDQQCTIHAEAARRVVALYEKLIKYEANMNKKVREARVNHGIKEAPYLRIMIKSLEGAISRIPDHLRTGLAPRRVKPFWVYLYGDPRIGKTAILQPHLVNALSKTMNLVSKYEDYTNYTYLRNCGEDYWEGYDNHPVLWYNDLFQNFSDETKMNQAVMELTNIIDDNVYPLEMAFERKHCVYFNSKLVISNAQNDILGAGFIQNKCWSGGRHLFARRNICLRLKLNPAYADANVGINYNYMRTQMQANPAGCVGYDLCSLHTPEEYSQKLLFPDDMYVMEFTDPNTGNMFLSLSYTDGIKYVCDEAKKYTDSQSLFKNKLYNHFAESWAQAEDDDTQVEPVFYDARLAENSDFVEAILSSVIREISEAMPDLIDADEVYNRMRAQYQDGIFQYDMSWIAINRNPRDDCTTRRDDVARVKLMVEILGEDYFRRKDISWWKRFCIRFKSWVRTTWDSAKSFISNHVDSLANLGASLVQCLSCCIGMIVSFKLYCTIFRAMLALFGPRIVYLKEGERVEDTFQRQQPILDQQELEMIYTHRQSALDNLKANSAVDAQTHEGKAKSSVPQVLRVKKNAGTVAQSYDVQNNIVENKLNKQMVKFTIRVFNDDMEVHNRRFGSGLCLGADIFVAPYHFWVRWFEMKSYWESHGLRVELHLNWNEMLGVKLDWDSMFLCRLNYNHTEDLAYFRIKNLVQKEHLKKFFMCSNDRPVLTTLYIYGKRANSFELTTMGVTNGEYKTTVYTHESKDDPLYGGKFAKREIVIPMALYYYNCCTTSGDCGTMVLNCDQSMNCRKVMAMHTAGHEGEAFGIGSLIFQEDIQEVFDYFYPDGFSIKPTAMEFSEPDDTLGLAEMGLMVMGKLPRLVVPEYNIDKQPVLMMPRKSKISRSIVHDIMEEDYGPTTLAVAHLRPFIKDEQRISPLKVALSKMVVVSPMPNAVDAQIICQHMYETITGWRSSYEPKILSDDEVVNGYGLLNAIEMKTSPGYPYVMIDNSAGKHPFFDVVSENPMKYKANSYLTKCIKSREEMAANGEIPPTFFIDTLKDETRPIDKVQAGKTRLFQISPLDYNMLLRKYFGAFLAHCQEAYLYGEGAVGINANSTEWTLMIKLMLNVGDRFINGDGKNFDACAGQAMAMHNVEVINNWYQTGSDWLPVHDRIRRTLWATFLNSFHIIRDVVYQALQGNKSGTFVTTWFNNLTGMFAIRWTFIRNGYQLHDFHRAIFPKFFGDDDLIAVNINVAPRVTTKAHQKTLLLLGIEYTSATKTEVIDTWYTIEQVSFLKRSFTFDGTRYLPRLEHQVIYEIPRWSESNPENMIDQMNRFNSSLLEVSNYGREEFNKLRSSFVEYCFLIKRRGMSIDCTQLFHFDYCEFIKWGELYKPIQLIIDRARASDVASVVLYESIVGDVQLSNSEDNVSLHSSVLNQAANAQTHEGKSAPPKAQIIRKPKTQGEEDEKDFELYLTMMEYLKQMEPCFKNFERAMNRSLRQPMVKWTASTLYVKVSALLAMYNECTKFFSTDVPLAQGEEGVVAKIPTMVFENSNMKIIPSDESVKEVVKEQTTYIINSNTPHQPPVIHNTVPKADNSNLYTDMDMYFKRPQIVGQFQWKTTDTIWSSKGVWHFPKDYITLPGIAQKLAMVTYSRPDFEFEIMINATKFHYGRIVFCVIPFYSDGTNTIPACYDKAYNAFTWPHWYQITAGSQQNIKFVVPYRHIMSQIELGSTSSHNRYMFSIKAYVSVPLASASSKTGISAPVEGTIMCRMIHPRLYGNAFSGSVAQGEEVSLSRQGIVVSNPQGPASVGVISGPLDGVSKITRDLSQLAYSAGFSNPVNLGATSSMQIRQPLLNKMNDLANSVKLGPDMQGHLQHGKEYVNSASEDDMNINEIISAPALLNTFQFKYDDDVGKRLFGLILTPDNMVFGGDGYTAPTGAYYPLPVNYISKFFNMWRGGWKIHFSVVASAFHTARLRIFYIPGGMDTSVGVPAENLAGLQQSSYLRNIVWDIAKTSDITIRVPYECNTHWRYCNSSQKNSNSGYIGLQVMNTLSASTPDTAPPPVYIQVFISADDDFQFTFPGRRAIEDAAWAPDFAVPNAQGEETTACQLPCSSSTCLREQTGILMGDIDSRTRKFNDCVSSNYTSVKQLVNMLTPIDYFQSKISDATDILGRSYTPFGTQAVPGYENPFWYAPINTITPLFRFVRGSFRVHVMTNEKIQIGMVMKADHADVGMYGPSTVDIMNGTGVTALALRNSTMGYAHFYDNSLYPADVTVPYYHAQPCLLTCNGSPSSLAQKTVPCLYVGCSTQKTAKNIIFCVSGGDDYMLGYRMAVPRVRNSAAPASLLSIGKRSTEEVVANTVYEDPPPKGTPLKKGEHLVNTKDGLKLRRDKRSFIERIISTPNDPNSVTDDESDN